MKKTLAQRVLAPQLGDLALDPDRRQALQPRGDAAVERADGVDLAVAVRRSPRPSRGQDTAAVSRCRISAPSPASSPGAAGRPRGAGRRSLWAIFSASGSGIAGLHQHVQAPALDFRLFVPGCLGDLRHRRPGSSPCPRRTLLAEVCRFSVSAAKRGGEARACLGERLVDPPLQILEPRVQHRSLGLGVGREGLHLRARARARRRRRGAGAPRPARRARARGSSRSREPSLEALAAGVGDVREPLGEDALRLLGEVVDGPVELA
mgnify:CR=1 FL=1